MELRDEFEHQHPGLRDALLHSLLHIFDRLIDVDHKAIDAVQKIIIVFDCIERMQATATAQAYKRAGRRTELIHWRQVRREALARKRCFTIEFEQVIAQLILPRQRVSIDPDNPGEMLAVELVHSSAMFCTYRVDVAIVVAVIAYVGRKQWVQFKRPFEMLVEQCGERHRRIDRICCTLASKSSAIARREQQQDN